MNQLTTNFENKTPTHMIYLDFAKAFDSVPHGKLVYLLKHLKIDKQVIGWIAEYLNGRTQTTIVDNFESRPCNISSGVPQGSSDQFYF